MVTLIKLVILDLEIFCRQFLLVCLFVELPPSKGQVAEQVNVLRFLFLHTLFFFELYFELYLIGTTIS